MKNGPARFAFYLDQLEKLVAEAAKQNSPALWLYQNGARTPLFMLEGLAKLYSGLHNKKGFEKIGAHFKLLEDALGAVDYYDGFAKQFSQDKAVSADITKFAESKSFEKIGTLNDLLIKKGWIGKGANRLSKIRKKLADVDWLDEKAEVKAIESFYRVAIKKVNAFAQTYRTGFTDIETQVHALRRKLRWLSIYPQALRGCIQLDETPSNDKNVAKYLVPEIVNSPFNKMPPAGTNLYLLMFGRDYFLALSWMIAELGKLKDQGLRMVVVTEAGKTSKTDAKNNAAILAKTTEITRTFFAEKNLDKLFAGIVEIGGGLAMISLPLSFRSKV